jgi:hypothetical protein
MTDIGGSVEGHTRNDATRWTWLRFSLVLREIPLKVTLSKGKPMGWVGVEAPENLLRPRHGSRCRILPANFGKAVTE